jgi:hypothetical protein
VAQYGPLLSHEIMKILKRMTIDENGTYKPTAYSVKLWSKMVDNYPILLKK